MNPPLFTRLAPRSSGVGGSFTRTLGQPRPVTCPGCGTVAFGLSESSRCVPTDDGQYPCVYGILGTRDHGWWTILLHNVSCCPTCAPALLPVANRYLADDYAWKQSHDVEGSRLTRHALSVSDLSGYALGATVEELVATDRAVVEANAFVEAGLSAWKNANPRPTQPWAKS